MNLKAWLTVLMLAVSPTAHDCWAWGATGHEWVSGIAIEKLPDTVPEFIRTPEAAAEIAVLGRELDRSKGAGKTHDAERDPGHLCLLKIRSDSTHDEAHRGRASRRADRLAGLVDESARPCPGTGVFGTRCSRPHR